MHNCTLKQYNEITVVMRLMNENEWNSFCCAPPYISAHSSPPACQHKVCSQSIVSRLFQTSCRLPHNTSRTPLLWYTSNPHNKPNIYQTCQLNHFIILCFVFIPLTTAKSLALPCRQALLWISAAEWYVSFASNKLFTYLRTSKPSIMKQCSLLLDQQSTTRCLPTLDCAIQ